MLFLSISSRKLEKVATRRASNFSFFFPLTFYSKSLEEEIRNLLFEKIKPSVNFRTWKKTKSDETRSVSEEIIQMP